MAIRVYKPTTAGRRNASVSDFSEITRSTPEKSLVRKLSKTGGRNSYGRMTSRHRGGGHKRQYRLIDFRRWDKDGVPAKVAPHRVRPEPFRPHRAAALCRRREALHHRAGGHQAGRRHRDRRPGRHQAGQQPAAAQHPDRYRGARDRAPPAGWRQDRPLRRCRRPARRQGWRPTPSCVCRPAKSATWTPAAAPPSVRSATPTTPTFRLGKGRPRPPGWASARSPVVSP